MQMVSIISRNRKLLTKEPVTPRSKAVLEKLTVARLVKFSAFYGI